MSLNQHPFRGFFWRENKFSRMTFKVQKWLTRSHCAIHHPSRRGHLHRVSMAQDCRELPAPCFPHTNPGRLQWFMSLEKGTSGGEGNEAMVCTGEVRPKREPAACTHIRIRSRTEGGQECFLLAACYKYYLSGQIFCFENSQIPRTASTHQSKRRRKKCRCFLHPKTSSKQTRSRLFPS